MLAVMQSTCDNRGIPQSRTVPDHPGRRRVRPDNGQNSSKRIVRGEQMGPVPKLRGSLPRGTAGACARHAVPGKVNGGSDLSHPCYKSILIAARKARMGVLF